MEYINKEGVFFHKNAPSIIIDLILSLIENRRRVSISYGDCNSGKSWSKVVTGCIFKSTHNVPVIIGIDTPKKGNRVFANNIVRICAGEDILYQHPNYH